MKHYANSEDIMMKISCMYLSANLFVCLVFVCVSVCLPDSLNSQSKRFLDVNFWQPVHIMFCQVQFRSNWLSSLSLFDIKISHEICKSNFPLQLIDRISIQSIDKEAIFYGLFLCFRIQVPSWTHFIIQSVTNLQRYMQVIEPIKEQITHNPNGIVGIFYYVLVVTFNNNCRQLYHLNW